MNPEQQKLQTEIEALEKKELEVLASTILNETQKNSEKDKITKEISALKVKLEEIKKQTDESKKEITDVKNSVGESLDSRWTYKQLIKWSSMEAQLKALNKTDAQIEEISLRIDSVVRKYYAKELEWFPSSIIDGMVAGTQPAMIEALTSSWAASAELFTATAEGLSENWLGDLFNKISGAIGNIKNTISGALGPLTGEGPLPTLAKRVQNLTAFVVLHKVDLIDGAVPQLVNPYKFKELLSKSVWDTSNDFNKPETLALFSLHTAEWGQLDENEKIELKKIVNNPALKMDEKTLSSMEKALETTDKFLDKRSFFQDAFMGIFDKIKGPLSLFMGKWKNILPSTLLWTGLLGTAFGVAWLDAVYLSKNVVATKDSSPTQVKETLTDTQLKNKIEEELLHYSWTPLSSSMILATSKKFSVPVEYIMAFMKNDSSYGTAWLATTTHNPWNVWNMNDKSTKDWWTWEAGVDAVWDNLKARIDAYHLKINKDKYPTVAELAKWVSDDGRKFFGVYMTAEKWPQTVTSFEKDLAQAWLSNKEEFLAVA